MKKPEFDEIDAIEESLKNQYVVMLEGKYTRHLYEQGKILGIGSQEYLKKLIADDIERVKREAGEDLPI